MTTMKQRLAVICAAALLVCVGQAGPGNGRYFTILVVDDETGRGIPLAELETVSRTRWVTDSNGIAAIDEPGLMGQEVYFSVRSHGYEYPEDMFGYRGVKLRPASGKGAIIRMKRLNIAERLYRVTGEGIYRDTVLTGGVPPTRRPLLNAQVAGQDTVIATPYRGKIYWFWGDTDRVGYPLGHFGAAGATSELPEKGGLNPAAGVDLEYFTDESGFSRPMCPLPGWKEGMRWIEGLMTVPDARGRELLMARVANMRDLDYAYDWHLMRFNDDKGIFESVQRWDIHGNHDSAHPFRTVVNGAVYYYIHPDLRVRATAESLYDLQNYEALTCAAGDGKLRGRETKIERDALGRPAYAWKPGADRLSPDRMRDLVAAGVLKPGERWTDLHDVESGARLREMGGRGSVCWNEFRRRWVMIISGKPGEIWFAEGDTPTGPWVYARRVVTHDNYNFYNPTQHPFFDQEGGRLIYFEATYVDTFSAAKEITPRYNYNQVMYRLALDDERLVLPAPVYAVGDPGRESPYMMGEAVAAKGAWSSVKEAAFFAVPPSRTRKGLVPVFQVSSGQGMRLTTGPPSPAEKSKTPLFYALPADPGLPSTLESSLTGRWACSARTGENDELKFTLNIVQKGTAVEVTGTEGIKGTGVYEGGSLSLNLEDATDSYVLTATLRNGQLAGEWKQPNGPEHGTWSGAWLDMTPVEYRSEAVTELYEYKSPAGALIYSTDPAPGGALVRSPKPLCRVWKNPTSVLALDPAKPVRYNADVYYH
jgi:hypothetical protein